ncbi:MAG TPA: 2Fe-2S iron-sulfur cluster-binding protein [Planctomycetota bacterium]|nr:2Fe-2S iron-sulfur cluster-binding protein [Planctomycetota bacterium]
MTKITINGRVVEADPKKPLIQACHENGADVPMYCYHPGLTPVGSCRICQVEVQQGTAPGRVVVACRTPVVEGMVVDTESPKAHEVRRECLEFLLKNHPLDCPICDKAGECDLQDYAFAEGQGEGRSNEPRRKLDKRKSLGDVIVLDEERCILCSRCVRFMEEIPKTPQLAVADLGSRSVIATFMDRPLSGNYQGNLADVCPVGALTLKQFRFQARVWNLKKTLSTCGECSRGCAITVEVLRGKDVKRFRPRYEPAVNQWWMCDTGRFSSERHNAIERVVPAARRVEDLLRICSVDEALAQAAETLLAHSGAVCLASPFMTVEEGKAFGALCKSLGATPAFVSPPPSGLQDSLLNTGDPCPNRRGLAELGFEAVSVADARARIAGASVSVLAGERVIELCDRAMLATMTATRIVTFDTHALEGAAAMVCVGIPEQVEKIGHWVNVDGHVGKLSMARPVPLGIEPLTRTLASLTSLLATSGASSR